MVFSICASLAPRPLPSFPTRRSSDLVPPLETTRLPPEQAGAETSCTRPAPASPGTPPRCWPAHQVCGATPLPSARRSEEHTSELQSRENLVCRLLLEKKKTIKRDSLH